MSKHDYIYISGPMRGHDDLNFPAFFEAEELAREYFSDADFLNPAREDMLRFNLLVSPRDAGLWLNTEGNFTHDDLRAALRDDLSYIADKSTAVIALPGWEDSRGAQAEVATADALGIPVYYFEPGIGFRLVTPPERKVTVPRESVEVNRPTTIDVLKAAMLQTNRTRLQEMDSSRLLEVEPGLVSTEYRADGTKTETFENGEVRTTVKEPPPLPCPGCGAREFEWHHLSCPATTKNGEVRTTSVTGGQKGTKLAAFDQVSPEVEMLVAEHFGKGARKYSAHNFRKGYEWSKSYSALRRHLAAFWAGEEYDNHTDACGPDCVDHTGSLHIVAVIWHAMVLTEFYLHHREYDDRFRYYNTEEEEANE